MTGKRITDLLDNAVIAAAEVGEWLLRRVPARDPQVRRAELSREALQEVLTPNGGEPCETCGQLDCRIDTLFPVSVASGATDTSSGEVSTAVDPPSTPPTVPSPERLLLDDFVDELKDAVGDHYDHAPTLTSGYHPLFPFWHEDDLREAFDWEGIALTLLRYFDITRKAQ